MIFYFKGNPLKSSILVCVLSSSLFLLSTNATAGAGHRGHGSSVNKSGASACKSTVITHIRPVHLTTVKPKSAFSFWVQGIKDPEKITVTAKKLPVKLTIKKMHGQYAYKANLPDSLAGTAARIQVTVTEKRCPTRKGWLLKISD